MAERLIVHLTFMASLALSSCPLPRVTSLSFLPVIPLSSANLNTYFSGSTSRSSRKIRGVAATDSV